jgi:hypothetical protein
MDYERAYGWKSNTFNESEMALFSECMPQCARKVLDTADIVREACSRQSWMGEHDLSRSAGHVRALSA